MCHIQHMLPSSSPFGGRPSCGTRQDFSLTWSGGTTWCSVPGAKGLSPGPWEVLNICLRPHCQCLCGCVGMEADHATHTDTCNHIYFAWHAYTLCTDMIICQHITDIMSLYQTSSAQQLIKTQCVFSAGTYSLHTCTDTKNPWIPIQKDKCKHNCLQMHINTRLQLTYTSKPVHIHIHSHSQTDALISWELLSLWWFSPPYLFVVWLQNVANSYVLHLLIKTIKFIKS